MNSIGVRPIQTKQGQSAGMPLKQPPYSSNYFFLDVHLPRQYLLSITGDMAYRIGHVILTLVVLTNPPEVRSRMAETIGDSGAHRL